MGSQRSSTRGACTGIPVLPVILAIGACISSGLWFAFMGRGLAATKSAAYLMLMPTPRAFVIAPALFLATLVATVALSVAALALAAARGAGARRGVRMAAPYMPAAGLINALLFLLTLWLAGMLAISVLWAGAAMVSEKSTADAAVTLKSVDPAIHRLIFQASGGAINGTETGFIVSVGDPKAGPIRDVDIGKSSCSLFCFVFARAMMSDSNECYCDPGVMAQIHDTAKSALKASLVPAAACAFAALACVLGLLVCGAGQFGGADVERRGWAAAGGGGAGGGTYKVYARDGDSYGSADQST